MPLPQPVLYLLWSCLPCLVFCSHPWRRAGVLKCLHLIYICFSPVNEQLFLWPSFFSASLFSSPFPFLGLHTSHHDGGAGLVSFLTEAQLGGGRCTRSVFPIAILIVCTPLCLYPIISIPRPQLPNHFARVNNCWCVVTQGQGQWRNVIRAFTPHHPGSRLPADP